MIMLFRWTTPLLLLLVANLSSAYVAPRPPVAATPATLKKARTRALVVAGTQRIGISNGSRPTSSSLPASLPVEFIDPSYNLALGAFGVGLVGGFLEDLRDQENEKLITAKLFGAVALVFTLFAGFLAFQTTTLRFTFDDTAFSLVRPDGSSIGDNIKVGGENRWEYSKFVNWDFLPNDQLPILVYFKETQTPEENRADAPIVVDDLAGQAHFFPVISNAQQLKQAFVEHSCAKVD